MTFWHNAKRGLSRAPQCRALQYKDRHQRLRTRSPELSPSLFVCLSLFQWQQHKCYDYNHIVCIVRYHFCLTCRSPFHWTEATRPKIHRPPSFDSISPSNLCKMPLKQIDCALKCVLQYLVITTAVPRTHDRVQQGQFLQNKPLVHFNWSVDTK